MAKAAGGSDLEGTARLTTASGAGNLLYVPLQAIRASTLSLDDLTAGTLPDNVGQGLKDVYLGNELVPIPIPFEMEGSSLPSRVLISMRSRHFVESATPDRAEGEVGVDGVVESLIAEGGYASSEKRLLHDWEWWMKRKLMTSMDDAVAKLAATLHIDLPDDGPLGVHLRSRGCDRQARRLLTDNETRSSGSVQRNFDAAQALR